MRLQKHEHIFPPYTSKRLHLPPYFFLQTHLHHFLSSHQEVTLNRSLFPYRHQTQARCPKIRRTKGKIIHRQTPLYLKPSSWRKPFQTSVREITMCMGWNDLMICSHSVALVILAYKLRPCILFRCKLLESLSCLVLESNAKFLLSPSQTGLLTTSSERTTSTHVYILIDDKES